MQLGGTYSSEVTCLICNICVAIATVVIIATAVAKGIFSSFWTGVVGNRPGVAHYIPEV